MRNECNIIRDILPLFSEDMVSDDTAAFVKEHLEKCTECRTALEAMKDSGESGVLCAENVRQREAEAVPLKRVKKQLQKRKFLTMITSVFFVLVVICIYLQFKPISIDYGASELYSHQDMDSAVKVIKARFSSWKGYKLYSISYTNDGLCKKELEYCNSLGGDHEDFAECIVFNVYFRSPLFASGALNPHETYIWSFYLARTENGDWQLLTWGEG